jgi:hypothetical protein
MESLSGTGFLFIDGAPRGLITYRLTPRDMDGVLSIDGVLAGEVKLLMEAWMAGQPIELVLEDNRRVRGIVSAIEGNSARFLSSGPQEGF